MIVELNGAPHELADGVTLTELIESSTGSIRGSAVVVDDQVIPRGTWGEYVLRGGQRIELITAVQGG